MKRNRVTAGVATFLAAVLLVAGCGSKSNPNTGGDNKTAVSKDTLVVANNIEFPTFDPPKVLGIDAIVGVANMYDRLVYFDADAKIKPWLATEWKNSEDGKTWTFQLRKDAKFHDGTPVTSADVKWSFERSINGPPSLGKTYLSPIVKIDTPDPYVVVLTTKEPLGPMLNHVGHQVASAIMNRKVVEANNGDLSKAVDAGGGMYKLVEWKRNEQLVLERNEDWWGPKPAFKRIVYKPVPETATRVVMLEKGEVDVVTSLPLIEVARLKKNKDVNVIETASIRSMFYNFNVTKAPTDNVKVREAINRAIDVEGIIKSVMEGYGERSNSVMTPPMPFYSPSNNFKFDMAAAKKLIQEAGVQPGTKLTIQSPQGRWPSDAEITQAVAGNLRELGFIVDVKIIGDWAKFQQEQKDGNFQLSMTAWAPGTLDADGTFSSVTLTGGANNYGKYSNKQADDLTKKGANSMDPKVRAGFYKELQDLLGKEIPYLLLHNSKTFSATRSNICGVGVRGDEAHILKDAKVCP